MENEIRYEKKEKEVPEDIQEQVRESTLLARTIHFIALFGSIYLAIIITIYYVDALSLIKESSTQQNEGAMIDFACKWILSYLPILPYYVAIEISSHFLQLKAYQVREIAKK